VADTYDLAAPDLLEVLSNVTMTSKTIISREDQLGVFFDDLTGLAGTSSRILAENEVNMIRVGEVTAPIVRLLATYSPQFPCLLRGLDKYDPLLSKTFAGDRIRQYVELGAPQYDAYDEDDRPTYGEVGRGPWCAGLPNPKVPSDGFALDQGSDIDESPPTNPLPNFRTPAGFSNVTSGYAGSEAEQAVVNALLSARSGRPVDSYGALPGLMYAPMLRGEGVDR
ncbi:MCE family protein, partial [Nocardioides sp.]|uniref:MCE family protein n=1 Tax=Nocardioides sp. TaxID=35761 RepID=UPI0027355FF1